MLGVYPGRGAHRDAAAPRGGGWELPVTSVPLSAPLAGQEQEAEAPLRHPLHVRGPGVPAQEAHREEGTERGWGRRRGPRPPSVRVVLGGPGWPGGISAVVLGSAGSAPCSKLPGAPKAGAASCLSPAPSLVPWRVLVIQEGCVPAEFHLFLCFPGIFFEAGLEQFGGMKNIMCT